MFYIQKLVYNAFRHKNDAYNKPLKQITHTKQVLTICILYTDQFRLTSYHMKYSENMRVKSIFPYKIGRRFEHGFSFTKEDVLSFYFLKKYWLRLIDKYVLIYSFLLFKHVCIIFVIEEEVIYLEVHRSCQIRCWIIGIFWSYYSNSCRALEKCIKRWINSYTSMSLISLWVLFKCNRFISRFSAAAVNSNMRQ